MANLVQVAEELEYVPKDQLIEYSQNPDSRYPQYLVLSEIQRRTQMERMYNAHQASMNQPTTTVAEEVVSDFAQPQGLGGMNVNGSANADAFSPQAGMPAAPMQMAASGGRTGYYPGGTLNAANAMNQSMQTSRSRLALLASLGIDPRGKSSQEIEEEILFKQLPLSRQEELPVVDTDVDRAVNRSVDLQTVESPQSREEDSWLDKIGSAIKDRYTDEGEGLGAVDWSNVLWDASLAIPGGGAALGAVRLGKLGLGAARAKWGTGAIQQGLKNLPGRARRTVDPRVSALVTKPKKVGIKDPTPKILGGKGGKSAAAELGYVTPKGLSGSSRLGKITQPRTPSATRIGLTGAGLFGASTLHDFATKDEGEKLTEIHPTYKKRIVDKVGELTQDPKSGLGGKMKSYLDQADGLDIAKLGGIVMGARNMSELGQGITALASDIQTRRQDERSEERLTALSNVQGGLYEEQTKQIKAEIAAMPADRLDALLKKYGDYAEAIEEGMIDISDDSKNSFWLQYRQLLDSAAEKEGYKFKSQAESDEEALDIVDITG